MRPGAGISVESGIAAFRSYEDDDKMAAVWRSYDPADLSFGRFLALPDVSDLVDLTQCMVCSLMIAIGLRRCRCAPDTGSYRPGCTGKLQLLNQTRLIHSWSSFTHSVRHSPFSSALLALLTGSV